MKRSALLTTSIIIAASVFCVSGCDMFTADENGEAAKSVLLYAQTEHQAEPEISDEISVPEGTEADYEETVEVTEQQTAQDPQLSSIVFKNVDRYVSSSRNYIVRSDATNYSDSIVTSNGEIHVTGESENGMWYRVEINGEEGYVRASVFDEEIVEEDDIAEDEIAPDTEASEAEETEAASQTVAPVASTNTTTTTTTTTVTITEEVPVETTAAAEPEPVAATTPVYPSVSAYEILDMINNYRAENGLGPLSWSDDLAASAQVRASEIVAVWSHTRPDGSDWYTSGATCMAENLACGSGENANLQALFNSWVNSDGHRANMLNPDYNTIGCGAVSVDGVLYAVQHFGY